jgi:hypothetical protein
LNVGFDDGAAGTGFVSIDDGFGARVIVDGVGGDPTQGVAAAPVILTSIRDDSVGPRGQSEDTNADSSATAPAAADWEGIHVGAWAKNFGRISPINGQSLSASFVRNAEIRYANTALLMQSQSVEVSNSFIRDANTAIDALRGPALSANLLAALPQLSPTRAPSQPLVVNNLLVDNTLALRLVGGAGTSPLACALGVTEACPPRAILVNNTVDSNTNGFVINNLAGPLVMNNAITNNTGTGLNIDASSLGLAPQPVQVLRNLFFGNAANGTTGTLPSTIGGLEILNLDPAYVSPGAPDYNYRPTTGSPLVDSALSEFGNVLGDYGLVRAPDRDRLGTFRQDHFATPNVGTGSRPWLDLGSLELVEITSSFPRVIAMTPAPNSNFDNGLGPASVELEFSEPVTGVGPNSFTVEASGGDRSFNEGNEVQLTGQVSVVTAFGGTRWVFVPNQASSFNGFRDEIFRVTAVGTGAQAIKSVASGDTLDGDFLGTLPSGDGIEGGDYQATFTIGEVVAGNILYVDDSLTPCTGVPRNQPNLQLFTTIQAALAAAQAGDTIQVCPGVYTAPLTVTLPVTIESIEGALPRKAADGSLVPGTGTFISVQGAAAITFNNISGQTVPRLGSTRGGQNHGFIITTAPTAGSPTVLPVGFGIDVQASPVEIEGNVILSNTTGIRVDSLATRRMPNITNNLIVGNTRAGIDIISRNRDAVANITNNTISFNNNGILVSDDGVDANGRIVANIYNNIVTSNTVVGISQLVKSRPLIKHNNAWGNDQNRANFAGSLPNLPPSAFDKGNDGESNTPDDNPIPDEVCIPASTRCGNISVNPLFVRPVDPGSVSDRADFLRLGNFSLQSSSKLIDRALDEVAAARDFTGVTRIIDVPDIGIPVVDLQASPRSADIGAFEFLPSSVASRVAQRNRTPGRTNPTGPQAHDAMEVDNELSGRERRRAPLAGRVAITDYLLQQLDSQEISGAERPQDEWPELIDQWLDDEGSLTE